MRVQDGEDNLERKVINEGHINEQSSTEAESNSGSVLCTVSMDVEDMTKCVVHILVQTCIFYTLQPGTAHIFIYSNNCLLYATFHSSTLTSWHKASF